MNDRETLEKSNTLKISWCIVAHYVEHLLFRTYNSRIFTFDTLEEAQLIQKKLQRMPWHLATEFFPYENQNLPILPLSLWPNSLQFLLINNDDGTNLIKSHFGIWIKKSSITFEAKDVTETLVKGGTKELFL